MSDPERALVQFIERRLLKGQRRVRPTTSLFRRRVIDSMNILHLIGYVERALGRRLRDDEIVMSNFDSPRAIVRTFFL